MSSVCGILHFFNTPGACFTYTLMCDCCFKFNSILVKDKCLTYLDIQLTRQWRIIDNGESLVKILHNFLNLRQNIINCITQSFTFIYALMFGKRMESKFHDNKIRVAETLDPLTKMSSLLFRRKCRSDKMCFLPRF